MIFGDKIRAKYMGGEYVLFHPVDQGSIRLEEMNGFLEWFNSIRPWSQRDINNRRVVWTRWFGVPLQAWNDKFFKTVALKFGKPLRVLADIRKLNSIQYAKVLIRTPHTKISEVPFLVNIDGRTYHIWIKESEEEMVNQSMESNDAVGDAEDSGFVNYLSRSVSMVPESPEKVECIDDGGSNPHATAEYRKSSRPTACSDFRDTPPCNSNIVGGSRIVGFENGAGTKNSGSPSVNSGLDLRNVDMGPSVEMGLEESLVGRNLNSEMEYSFFPEAINKSGNKGAHLQIEADTPSRSKIPPISKAKPSQRSLKSNPISSESMNTSFDSQENIEDLSTDSTPCRLPTSITAVKNLARIKKNPRRKISGKRSFEEKRWKAKEKEEKLSEEARQAWEVGKKLGLTSKVTDDMMREQFRLIEKEEKDKTRKAKKRTESGANGEF